MSEINGSFLRKLISISSTSTSFVRSYYVFHSSISFFYQFYLPCFSYTTFSTPEVFPSRKNSIYVWCVQDAHTMNIYQLADPEDSTNNNTTTATINDTTIDISNNIPTVSHSSCTTTMPNSSSAVAVGKEELNVTVSFIISNYTLVILPIILVYC